jgi:two-component system response regulator DesR
MDLVTKGGGVEKGTGRGVRVASRILIVDDSEAVRRGLRTVLQTNPQWELCGECPDGLTAVELFRELNPALVILDFQMPGIDGLETARRMAQISPAVPIVLYTQHANPTLERLAVEVGIKAVVPKSNATILEGVIQTLLGSGESAPGVEAQD